MLKFLKWHSQVSFFLLLFWVAVANCYALTGTVTVKVTPGHQTVKTKAASATEVIGTNTAKFEVTATCDPKPAPNEEVKAVEPSWTITRTATFLPPLGVTPAPTNPGTLLTTDHTAPSSTGSWYVTALSSKEGEWRINFTVKVKYKLKDSVRNTYLLNSDGTVKTQEFTGTGNCRFKATDSKFKLEIKPDDDFIGNRSTLGIGEPAEVVISKWESTDPDITFVSMYATGTNSATPPTATLTGVSSSSSSPSGAKSFEAGHYAGTAALTVNVTIGGIPLTDSIGVTVLEPSGAGIVQTHNTFKWHNHDTASIGFKGTSYYLPDTVSFWKVGFKEGGGTSTATGYLDDRGLNGITHSTGSSWLTVRKGIDPLTNKINTETSEDTISQGPFTIKPYKDGTFIFPIDWLYKVGSHEGKVMIMVSSSSINPSGDMTRSKGGATKSAKYGDRNSTYATGPDR